MSDQEQWTPGTTPSDAKLGTDDPAEERRNVEGQVASAGTTAGDAGGDGGSSDDDAQPEDTGATGTLGDHDVP